MQSIGILRSQLVVLREVLAELQHPATRKWHSTVQGIIDEKEAAASELQDTLPMLTEEQKKKPIGELIDAIHAHRDAIRERGGVVEALKSEKAALEEVVIELMDIAKLPKAGGSAATASISESEVPQVTDWDAFWKYIFRNKATHLLERCPAAAPYREELVQRNGKLIPGVKSFMRRTLNLRSL